MESRVRHDLVTKPPSSLRYCLLKVNLIWEVSRFISVKQGADFSRGCCHLSIAIPFLLCCCLIICCPLLLLPLVFPSIRVFSNKLVLGIEWPNCWSFSFSISPSNEYSGRISFRMDWFDLLSVQATLKSLLHTLQKHQFFGAQLSSWFNSNIHP